MKIKLYENYHPPRRLSPIEPTRAERFTMRGVTRSEEPPCCMRPPMCFAISSGPNALVAIVVWSRSRPTPRSDVSPLPSGLRMPAQFTRRRSSEDDAVLGAASFNSAPSASIDASDATSSARTSRRPALMDCSDRRPSAEAPSGSRHVARTVALGRAWRSWRQNSSPSPRLAPVTNAAGRLRIPQQLHRRFTIVIQFRFFPF